MNFYIRKVIVLAFIFSSFVSAQSQNVSLKDTESFFPNAEVLKKDTILWKYLSVPENWDKPQSNIIKLAVAVLKNKSGKTDRDALVFIQGGPGASGIQNIGNWFNHPLRQENDIVLFDIRGTGFSEPRLCPDLGKKFLDILAKNQSEQEDENQKTAAALSCKQNLLNSRVDIKAYHSQSVAKDLHALKNQLKYDDWHVYGVSYGTYMAQVYATSYPEDIKTLSLDSPISDMPTYYSYNTSNYVKSLSKVFKKCKGDKDCNAVYPDLEKMYYKTVADLEKAPITVSVDKKTIASGEFTYNSEDFKIAIQQALYTKQLIEMIPLLIYQFQQRNNEALGKLVAAFSSLLGMDYGVYYCVSCNEALPFNKISDYKRDASKHIGLKGGVSFYKSDFKVCDKWNINRNDSISTFDSSKLETLSFPVLVFSGGYDPITPSSNGKVLAKVFSKGYSVIAASYGHTPGFTKTGNKIAQAFINDPNRTPDVNAFEKESMISFVKGVTINPGVSKVGNSLNQLNLIFLSPLFVALGIMSVFVFTYMIKLLRRKYKRTPDRIVRILSVLTSAAGITGLICLVLALMKVANQNYFILAFGLPNNFDYVFIMILIFGGFLIVTLLYFIMLIKRINDRSIVFSVLFSNILLVTYLFYWGIL
ncbi:alpha/beta fold hydrolase [Aquimarina sediminis]|uniref:alpha/beta fold hydrolase n=1 Tax=Aquimarina sediminis TaxID=2070536 RepID=UPI001F4E56D9|nr:alpha/beta fold hydrolase [Aquimarina sediminis]